MLHFLQISGPALVGSGSLHFSVKDLDTVDSDSEETDALEDVFMFPVFAASSLYAPYSLFCNMGSRAQIHIKAGTGTIDPKHGAELSFWNESKSENI
jgi:hypothetical protein